MAKAHLKLVAPATVKRTVAAPRRRPNAELRPREHLTEREVGKLIEAAKSNRHSARDSAMILICFRHGLRASELCELQWSDMADRAGEGSPSAQLVDLRNRLRHRRTLGVRDFLQGAPECIFDRDPGLASIDVDGALDDWRFHVSPSTDRHEASQSSSACGVDRSSARMGHRTNYISTTSRLLDWRRTEQSSSVLLSQLGQTCFYRPHVVACA